MTALSGGAPAALREALLIAKDIIDANIGEDSCRHGNYVYGCEEPDGCADRSRREMIDAAALSENTVDSLDEAWREAEAALPEGGRLHLQRRAEAEAVDMGDGKTWVARQGRAAGAYEAWATDRSQSLGFAYDATPAAALRALARSLSSRLTATATSDASEEET